MNRRDLLRSAAAAGAVAFSADTVLRAAAFGASGVIVSGHAAGVYDPKAVR
jgi:hypothetical protein